MNELFNELEGAGQAPVRTGGTSGDPPASGGPQGQGELGARPLGAEALLPPAGQAEPGGQVVPPSHFPAVPPPQQVDMGPILAAIGNIQQDVQRQMDDLRQEVLRRSPKRPRTQVCT